jgi:hypothetical protein
MRFLKQWGSRCKTGFSYLDYGGSAGPDRGPPQPAVKVRIFCRTVHFTVKRRELFNHKAKPRNNKHVYFIFF